MNKICEGRWMAFLMFFIFLLNLTLCAADVRLVKTVPIRQDKNEAIVVRIVNFVVTEDENFILPDAKAGNIKIFDHNGTIKTVVGRRGEGPNEYISPQRCAYQNQQLVIMDWGKNKLMMFDRKASGEIIKKEERLCLKLGYDMKIIDKSNILVSGYITDSDRVEYELYIYNWEDEESTMILPAQYKYGYNSVEAYNNDYGKRIAPIGINGYCDYHGDTIYFVWEGDLRILQIQRSKGTLKKFGEKTSNYTTPTVSPELIKYQKENPRKKYLALHNMSYITGIFVHNQVVGLTYVNYRADISAWQAYLQLYSLDGKFLLEKILEKAVNPSDWPDPCIFYSRENKSLYYLANHIDANNEDNYRMLKFQISE